MSLVSHAYSKKRQLDPEISYQVNVNNMIRRLYVISLVEVN
jgi:hypothetical protein